MSAAALVLLLAAGADAHVSPRDAHTCLVVPGGMVVAGLAGGVVVAEDSGPVFATALDGLPGTRVEALALATDAPGEAVFWVGTEAGLARLRWRAGRLDVERVMRGPNVRALASQGAALLVATWDAGLQRLEPGAEGLVRVAAHTSPLTSLAVRGDTVYAGSAGAGLLRLEGDVLTPVDVSLPSPFVWALAVDADRLLVGTMEGLASLTASGAHVLLSADVRALSVGPQGVLVGTFADGLFGLARGARTPARVAGAPDFVAGVAERDGAVCAAGPDGVMLRPRGATRLRAFQWAGPPSADISSLALMGSRLVVGTFDRGVAFFEAGRWSPLDAEALDPRVNALAADGRRLWIATARGLALVDEAGSVRRWTQAEGLPADDVHALCVLRDGSVVVGTASGAVVVREGVLQPLAGVRTPVDQAVWAIVEQDDRTLWLGTSRGLLARSPDGRWRRLSVSSGHLEDDWVTALAVREQSLWVGTYSGGVTRIALATPRGRARALGGGNVNPGGLALVGGTLYAATMDGLRARSTTSGTWSILRSAMLGVDVTAALPAADGLWVASRRGLAFWRPPGVERQ